MHQEKRPIFSRYQIEEQIDGIYEKKVPLKSGGSLVIEPTEALVSIDVNSGKSTGERNVEDTAFRTNLEAVEEAARQLRLRDLGGLIVLDLIDMREMKHIKEVEKLLKDSLKSDKARVTVGRISQFGMLEMSRQRIKQTLEQGSVLDCPHCSGRGKVKGVENMAISFLRKVHAAAAKGTAAEVRGELPLEVAYYLLNRKKRELAQIENDYDIEVTIKGKPSFLMNQLELLVIKREKPAVPEPQQQLQIQAVTETPVVAVVAPVVTPVEKVLEPEQPVDDGKPKKKRSSRKKVDLVQLEELPVEVSVIEELSETETVAAVEGEPVEATSDEPKKKRRRKRRKKAKSGTAEQQEPAESAECDEIQKSADETMDAAESPNSDEVVETLQKKRKRKRRKRGGARVSDAEAEVQPDVQPDVSVDIPIVAQSEPDAFSVEAPPMKPRARAPRKKKVAGEIPLAEVVVIAPMPTASPEPEVVKPKRVRAKKVAVVESNPEQPAIEAAVIVAKELKPKRTRSVAKKKVSSEAGIPE